MLKRNKLISSPSSPSSSVPWLVVVVCWLHSWKLDQSSLPICVECRRDIHLCVLCLGQVDLTATLYLQVRQQYTSFNLKARFGHGHFAVNLSLGNSPPWPLIPLEEPFALSMDSLGELSALFVDSLGVTHRPEHWFTRVDILSWPFILFRGKTSIWLLGGLSGPEYCYTWENFPSRPSIPLWKPYA